MDSASRLSLIFRGGVPGGSASASFRMQNELLDPNTPTYYGRVVRDGGYVILRVLVLLRLQQLAIRIRWGQ